MDYWHLYVSLLHRKSWVPNSQMHDPLGQNVFEDNCILTTSFFIHPIVKKNKSSNCLHCVPQIHVIKCWIWAVWACLMPLLFVFNMNLVAFFLEGIAVGIILQSNSSINTTGALLNEQVIFMYKCNLLNLNSCMDFYTLFYRSCL